MDEKLGEKNGKENKQDLGLYMGVSARVLTCLESKWRGQRLCLQLSFVPALDHLQVADRWWQMAEQSALLGQHRRYSHEMDGKGTTLRYDYYPN